MEQDIAILLMAYSKEDLARKYVLAQRDVLRLENENKKLNKEMLEWRKARPIGCQNCHRGNFSIDKYCSHCGVKLIKERK